MKRSIWISFDLGVSGDYEGLYAWLDAREAKECGDSLAFLSYAFEGDLIAALKSDIQDSIETNKKTRIYVIYHDEGKMKGTFILGGRRREPWTGYGPREVELDTAI